MSDTTTEAIAAARARLDWIVQSVPPPYTREGEIFLGYRSFDGGVCTKTGKPLFWGIFCWDHRITTGPHWDHKPFVIGEHWFDSIRHADGTHCESPTGPCCHSQPRCPECKQYNRTSIEQQAYGDRTTCPCGYERYYSIGD